MFKTILKTLISKAGYELHRSGTHNQPNGPDANFQAQVNLETFTNIAKAYELRLNELDQDAHPILPNETRPKLLGRLLGTSPSEAYYIVKALAKCLVLEGDVCEFGVAQGETSALIANEIVRSNKTLHLFDSFQGLPKPSEKDKLKDDIFSLGRMEAYTGTMSCPEEMVRARLAAISFPESRFAIHKGFFEQLLQTDRNFPKKVCFAYVDFDLYEPIKLALDFLHRVSADGAIIVVDDYDWFSTGAKTAVDEFVKEKNSQLEVYDCFIPDTRYGRFAVLTKKAPLPV